MHVGTAAADTPRAPHTHTTVPYATLSLQTVRAIERCENTPRPNPCPAWGGLVRAILCPCTLALCLRGIQHSLEDGADCASRLVTRMTGPESLPSS